jgi:pimeloyl-ACP methyl ester carboxylesterase
VDSARSFVRGMFVPSSDSLLENWIVDDMSSAPCSVAIGSVESAMSYSRRMPQTLAELKLPVIAINPDNAPTDVASLEHYGVKLIIMPGVGHFLMMEDPKRFNELLNQAIGTLVQEK